MIELSNPHLRLTIAEQGAEMQSLTDLHTGRELLWQGDAMFWKSRSPILFPNVGRLWGGKFRFQGKEYEQGAHGFVRYRLWKVEHQTETQAMLAYESTEEDLTFYPFPFLIKVGYALEGKEVKVMFSVENRGEQTMHFQLGAHPGFNVRTYADAPDDYGYLRIEGKAEYVLRVGEGGCLEEQKHPIPVNEEGFIPITVETFMHEALIFENHQADFVTLFDARLRPIVAVTCPTPVTLVWVPQGKKAPFVCIEPWYGMPDKIGFTGCLEERANIQSVGSQEKWEGGYSFVVF